MHLLIISEAFFIFFSFSSIFFWIALGSLCWFSSLLFKLFWLAIKRLSLFIIFFSLFSNSNLKLSLSSSVVAFFIFSSISILFWASILCSSSILVCSACSFIKSNLLVCKDCISDFKVLFSLVNFSFIASYLSLKALNLSILGLFSLNAFSLFSLNAFNSSILFLFALYSSFVFPLPSNFAISSSIFIADNVSNSISHFLLPCFPISYLLNKIIYLFIILPYYYIFCKYFMLICHFPG